MPGANRNKIIEMQAKIKAAKVLLKIRITELKINPITKPKPLNADPSNVTSAINFVV